MGKIEEQYKLFKQARVGKAMTEEGNAQFKRGTTFLDPTTGTTYVAREAYPAFMRRGIITQSFSEMDPKGGVGLLTSKLPLTAEIVWVPDYEVTGL